MFGVIVSGRPVLTDHQVVSETQFAFAIPAVPAFNHIVVFLLPGMTLPPDAAAAVYAQLPGSTEFKLLGAIANEKQSAIFKVNQKATGGLSDEDAMVDDSTIGVNGATAGANVMLGISLEPAAQVAANLQQQKAQSAAPVTGQELVRRAPEQDAVTTKVLAQRIIKNAYDFLASFGSDVVPLKAFQSWWEKFEKKIEHDPSFLERSDGG